MKKKYCMSCTLHKNEDIMKYKIYKGIWLLNTTYKLLSNILLIRLNPYIKEVIGK